ncbi:MAG: HIT domain-containing protein [Candidatus Omnitrophota bacterium]
MNRIWAPWRIGYIKNAGRKSSGCLFCRSLKSKRKNYIIARNKYSFAMLNVFPYNNGHVMISPKRHVKKLEALNGKEIADVFGMLKQIIRLLNRVLKPAGFNIGINIGKCGGAGIPDHLHLHVVPRWEADTNFMPVLSDTKVISQSLDDLYNELKKEIKRDVKHSAN